MIYREMALEAINDPVFVSAGLLVSFLLAYALHDRIMARMRMGHIIANLVFVALGMFFGGLLGHVIYNRIL